MAVFTSASSNSLFSRFLQLPNDGLQLRGSVPKKKLAAVLGVLSQRSRILLTGTPVFSCRAIGDFVQACQRKDLRGISYTHSAIRTVGQVLAYGGRFPRPWPETHLVLSIAANMRIMS